MSWTLSRRAKSRKKHSTVTGACIGATEDFRHEQLGHPGLEAGQLLPGYTRSAGLSDPGHTRCGITAGST